MKSAMIIMSLFMSVSSMAAVSYNCNPVDGRGTNFLLTNLPGNAWSYQSSADGNGIFRQGTFSYDAKARTQARGYDGFSGIVGYGSHDPYARVPRNVERKVMFVDRSLQNNLPNGQAILDGRYYSCGMLYRAPPRRPAPQPNPYPPGTKGNPGRGHGRH
jgi:hypothetical protein